MAWKTWTLTDLARDLHVDQLHVGPRDVGGPAVGYSVRKRTLAGGLRQGVDVVEVDNGSLRFTVVPTRGMGLWKAKLGDLEIGWRSPVQGPVHPHYVPLDEASGLGWLQGFDELLVRCGLESNGGPVHDERGQLRYPLHGRIANLPAHHVELSIDGQSGEIAVQGVVDEARLYGQKLRLTSTVFTRVGESKLRVVDEVTNLSAEPGELQLLYHVNFGLPLLDAGAHVVLPAKTVVPCNARAAEGVGGWYHYLQEEVGYTEQVYFFELLGDRGGQTRALLRNAHGNHGASLSYNTAELPCFTIWKSTQMAADGYVTGLEPATNYPNARTFEEAQNRVIRLAGGESRRFNLELEIHGNAESVAAAEKAIQVLQGDTKPTVFDQPAAPWSVT